MTHVCKEHKVKINMVHTGVITTSKNCYLMRGNKNLVEGRIYQGNFSWLKAMSKFLASGLTLHHLSSDNTALCCPFVSLPGLDTFEFFGLSSRSKLAIKQREFQSLSKCKLGDNIWQNFEIIFSQGFSDRLWQDNRRGESRLH